MKKNKEKAFDAVRTMREIRDAISRETAGMTYEEQRRYTQELLRSKKEKKV